ncbi:MAG TPA: M81 family metallopeptidase, partial [Hyphomicrobiaceae bacterium]|nr:M81 family metallopeptidase [Hyphomicrobiaceae bacterium]
MSHRPPRVAIIGVWLESNRAAPVTGESQFRGFYWLEGEAILEAARAKNPSILGEAAAFVKTMDATGLWEPVPILIAGAQPWGPVDGRLMDRFLDLIGDGLRQAGPLDAVYVANHGAMIATNRDDPDGEVIALAREIAGPAARIVVTLDLHGNISDRMVSECDLIVGYRTNPHVDMKERGEEAALSLRLMLAGFADPKSAFIRLPLTPASVNLLTASGPYGDVIDFGTRRRAEMSGDILNVSIFGGFVFSDTTKNGIAIIVTARDDLTRARALATEIAERCWGQRERFRKVLTPLPEAVRRALAAMRTAIGVASVAWHDRSRRPRPRHRVARRRRRAVRRRRCGRAA